MGKKEDDAVVAVEADRWVPSVSLEKEKKKDGEWRGLLLGWCWGRCWAAARLVWTGSAGAGPAGRVGPLAIFS